MEQLRILQVVSSLKSSAGDISVVMNYYRHLDRSKIQFDFLYFDETINSYKEEIILLGGNVYKIDPPGLKNILFYRKYIENYLKDNNLQYDIVHFHELLLVSLIAPVFRINGTRHIIAHSHSVSYSYTKLNAIRNYLLSLPITRLVDCFCACSKKSGEFWFGKKLLRNGEIKIINNAIDYEQIKFNADMRIKLRTQLNIENSFVIGHVGRFSKEKNHSFLIEIFAEVIKIEPTSILVLIGEGPYFKEIKKKVALLNLQKQVIFLGQRSDVYDYYQAMDVFVFPSLSEGLGMAAIEAQASGIPCVISNTVPDEVEISEVEFLPLRTSCREWAKAILNVKGKERINMENKIVEKGFYIKNEVKNLQCYYERLLLDNGKSK